MEREKRANQAREDHIQQQEDRKLQQQFMNMMMTQMMGSGNKQGREESNDQEEVIVPVVSYTCASLSYIDPQSAIVLSCMEPGTFMKAMGMVPLGQMQKTDVTKWLCFQPLQ